MSDSGAEKLGPLTEFDRSTGRRVVTAETATIIERAFAEIARIEKAERRESFAHLIPKSDH